MRRDCDTEALEELAHGRLPTDEATEVAAHVRRCAGCAQELALLRAERTLFDRRAEREPALPPEIWQAVERRIAERPAALAKAPRSGWRAAIAVGALSLAAAAAVVLVLRAPAPPAVAPPAPVAATAAAADDQAVLDIAEQQYRNAITVLEGELASAQRRGSPLVKRWSNDLSVTRTVVADASGAVGRDPDARLRVLDGYAAYLRSLQTVVLAIEERRR